MRIAVVVAGALALAGCFQHTPEQDRRTVCTAYCDCLGATVPFDQCVVECIPDLPPVSQACLDCVYTNSQMCTVLENECTDPCLDTGTPLLGGM